MASGNNPVEVVKNLSIERQGYGLPPLSLDRTITVAGNIDATRRVVTGKVTRGEAGDSRDGARRMEQHIRRISAE